MVSGLVSGLRGGVFAHGVQVPVPEARAAKFEDPPGLGARDEILHRAGHRLRIGALAAETQGFFEEIFWKHKIRTFHVFIVQQRLARVNDQPVPDLRESTEMAPRQVCAEAATKVKKEDDPSLSF